ncbi:MAG: hypothetical protein O7I42_14550 [Alphaproteobacteria bacterium]|nr:hypothetical protein [Alphaproteobacteria bacterium]
MFVFCAVADTWAADYERPANRSASNILATEVISGPHYRVRDEVVSYGYMHHYTVDSDFGIFEVTGDGALRKVIKEIYAIASLNEFKNSEAFLESVKKAAKAPFMLGKSLITNPVDTISGLPEGVSRIFGNISEAITMEHDPSEDTRIKQALFVSSWKRDFAAERGVDVYSSNKVLQEELNSVGWSAAIAGLSISAVSMGASATAVTVVSNMRLADQIGNVIKEEPPSRLRIINKERLRATGVSEGLANRFLDHPHFTPRHDTVITANLARLTDARGLDGFLESALAAMDEAGANFYMNMAQTLSGYNDTVARIEDVSIVDGLTIARAQNGRALIPFPLDYGVWSKRSSEITNHLVTTYRANTGFTGGFDLWVTGTVSPLAHRGFKGYGVVVTENIDERLRMVD